MAWRRGKVLRGRSRRVVVEVHDPDDASVHTIGGLGVATNPASPMSRGVDGWMPGDRGYGVNRMPHTTAPLQAFQGAAAEQLPRDLTLGGPSGVPTGLPGTGVASPSDLSGLFGIDVDMGLS